jgi:predicted MPP superfamily phosphohydrolase
LQVTTVDIFTRKFKNTELKIIQISDLHCDGKIRNEYKLVKLINQLKPDIIVFTGDSLNTQEALPVFKDTLKRLKAAIAKFAVRGNFDVWYWSDLDLLSNTGFEVLDSGFVKLIKNNEVFYISGLSCEYPNRYYEVLKKIPPGNFSIFLYHYPSLIEKLSNLNVDLYLAGHVHGGQVALPIYGALITFSELGKKYERGKYIVNNTILYLNRGVGMEGGFAPRVRFCSRPEIAVFNIKPKK